MPGDLHTQLFPQMHCAADVILMLVRQNNFANSSVVMEQFIHKQVQSFDLFLKRTGRIDYHDLFITDDVTVGVGGRRKRCGAQREQNYSRLYFDPSDWFLPGLW